MMTSAPPGAIRYKRTPTFTEATLPDALKRDHNTKSGVWAVIHVESGALRYRQDAPPVDVTLRPGETLACPPGVVHRVQPMPAVAFHIAFWREGDAR